MTDERTEQDITRVCRIASQLYGDLIRLLNIQPESAIEQQALQLICDSYETVGLMAMEVKSRYEANWPPTETESVSHGREKPCISHSCNFAEPHFHSEQGITVL